MFEFDSYFSGMTSQCTGTSPAAPGSFLVSKKDMTKINTEIIARGQYTSTWEMAWTSPNSMAYILASAHNRFLLEPFPDHQRDQTDHGNDNQRCHEMRSEPIIFLSFIKRNLESQQLST